MDSSVAGIATSNASVMPAVAIATVCQVSRATSSRNSLPMAGGKNEEINVQVGPRLPSSNSTHGRNSAATSIGHSTTSAAPSQNSRPSQAGSRCAGGGAVLLDARVGGMST